MNCFKGGLCVVLGLLCVSCGFSPEKRYKDIYSTQKHRKVVVMSDASVLQDGPGTSDVMLAGVSANAAKKLESLSGAELRAKGFSPSTEYVSTGAGVKDGKRVYASDDRKAKTGDFFSGAYSVHRRGRTPSRTQKYAVDQLHDRLVGVNLYSKHAADEYLSEVGDLGLDRDAYLLVVSGSARNVNASKQIAQGAVIAAVSLGTVVAYEPDSAMIQLVLVDVETRKIVWANRFVAASGKPDYLEKQMNKLFAKFPAYGVAKAD